MEGIGPGVFDPLLPPANEVAGRLCFHKRVSVILFKGGLVLPCMHHLSHDRGSASGAVSLLGGGLPPGVSVPRQIPSR